MVERGYWDRERRPAPTPRALGERLELVPCPALVPCVQRQKMVSDSPGLLLVPHTSSSSSLVTSDMMGTGQEEGLCFSDSGPGT